MGSKPVTRLSLAPFTISCDDPEGAPLDYDVLGAAHGTVTGRTYSPNKDYTGSDTITYTARDDANTEAGVMPSEAVPALCMRIRSLLVVTES